VIFIDDDVKLARGFVEAHRRVYLENPTVVAVAGRVEQTVPWPIVKRPAQWPRFMDYRFFRFDSDQRVNGFANFCGANHSILTKYVRSLGGYDEGYKGVALREETDLALRIYAAGGLIIFEPLASLLHLVAPSGGCRKKDAIDISGAMSIVRFSWKFRRVLRRFIFGELWHALRLGILNKQVLSRPYLIPAVIAKSILSLPKAIVGVQRKIG
jgi:GT2 family glycosyltransferase